MSRIVVLFSGGLDSTTLLYHLRDEGHEVKAISVNYGQRHLARELEAARSISTTLGIEHKAVDLRTLVSFLGSNSLTDHTVAVPNGEYAPETMTVTVVPNRNMILLSVTIAWAITLEFDTVAFGAHGGEYTPYPDCQPPFADAMNLAGHRCHTKPIEVLAPFVAWDKAEIVQRGSELGVPFNLTWSCYKGGAQHCGECGTCIDRQRAFAKAGVFDPTSYARR